MRVIKFRGKDRRTGAYVTGDLLQPCHEYEQVPTIRADWNDYREVDPATVAQFIDVDKNGCEIYEGDHYGDKKHDFIATMSPFTKPFKPWEKIDPDDGIERTKHYEEN